MVEAVEVPKGADADDDYEEIRHQSFTQREKTKLDGGILQTMRNLVVPRLSLWAVTVGLAASATLTTADATAVLQPEAAHALETSVHAPGTAHALLRYLASDEVTTPAVLHFSGWNFRETAQQKAARSLLQKVQPTMTILDTRGSGAHDEFAEDLALQQYHSGKGWILYSLSDAPSSAKLPHLPGVAMAAAFNDRLVINP